MKKSFLVILCIVFAACVSNAAELQGLDSQRISFNNTTINKISKCTFEDVNIRDSHLQNATIDHLTMKRGIIAGTDFSSATISNSTFTDIWPWYWGASANFTNTKITNTSFERIDLGGIDFSGSHFTDVIFTSCTLKDTNFKSCTFTNVKFIDCNANSSKFIDCAFDRVAFTKCDVSNMNFTKNTINSVDMSTSLYSGSMPSGIQSAISTQYQPKHSNKQGTS